MKAAVLGSPIAHSKSPLLHLAAYSALGLPWTYDRYEVSDHQLAAFVSAHRTEYRGFSLTMPLKNVAFALADQRDEAATATAACNTLVFDGNIKGFNTDVPGFVEALRYRGIDAPSSVAILGTGATARSAAVAMQRIGASEITVVGRRHEALTEFVTWFAGIGGRIAPRIWDDPVENAELTISTTPAGATDDRALPGSLGTLFDVVYAPWPTGYARAWQTNGGATISGLDLLVHQAAEQVLLMTGVADAERVRIVAAMYKALAG